MNFRRGPILFGALALLIAAVFIVKLRNEKKTIPPSPLSEKASASTPVSDSKGLSAVSGTGDFTIEKVPLRSYPSLARPIKLPPVFEGQAAESMLGSISRTLAILKKDPGNVNAWYALALNRKMINDYAGAVEIWEFLKVSGIKDSAVFVNLGELYHLYLKNYAKSELNYRMAISKLPVNLSSYSGLHELYKYSYKKETAAAADILKEGISKNPEAIDLMVLLARYYEEKKDFVSARLYYEKAAAEARRQGDISRADLIEKDLKALDMR
ncbi:MAG: hypothetical protein HYT43_01060 [Candidatus Taylorbacteria bacterium]|nr:hypothetical protein [Candidatus Taylorbacteria bacterium]